MREMQLIQAWKYNGFQNYKYVCYERIPHFTEETNWKDPWVLMISIGVGEIHRESKDASELY